MLLKYFVATRFSDTTARYYNENPVDKEIKSLYIKYVNIQYGY